MILPSHKRSRSPRGYFRSPSYIHFNVYVRSPSRLARRDSSRQAPVVARTQPTVTMTGQSVHTGSGVFLAFMWLPPSSRISRTRVENARSVGPMRMALDYFDSDRQFGEAKLCLLKQSRNPILLTSSLWMRGICSITVSS